MSDTADAKVREPGRGEALGDYVPLIALVGVAAAAGAAIADHAGGGGRAWMHYFMGFFLTCFALLKLFDLPGFADGFEMYDLVARRSRAWAYAYPFVELGLGLAYLGFFAPRATYLLTIGVMGVGSLGVVRALRDGLDIECPCMGSVLKVPLSTVTLTEDLGMGLMAAAMLALGAG